MGLLLRLPMAVLDAAQRNHPDGQFSSREPGTPESGHLFYISSVLQRGQRPPQLGDFR